MWASTSDPEETAPVASEKKRDKRKKRRDKRDGLIFGGERLVNTK
jgi:hypothetical protein